MNSHMSSVSENTVGRAREISNIIPYWYFGRIMAIEATNPKSSMRIYVGWYCLAVHKYLGPSHCSTVPNNPSSNKYFQFTYSAPEHESQLPGLIFSSMYSVSTVLQCIAGNILSLMSLKSSLYSYVLHFIIEQQSAECDAQIESGTVGTYECCAFCEVQDNDSAWGNTIMVSHSERRSSVHHIVPLCLPARCIRQG